MWFYHQKSHRVGGQTYFSIFPIWGEVVDRTVGHFVFYPVHQPLLGRLFWQAGAVGSCSQPCLVTNSIHFCWLFKIKVPCKKVRFQQPHNQGLRHLLVTVRQREIFWGFSALWFLKNLSTFLSALAISGHSERFSPGPNGSEVGGPRVSHSPSGRPTSDRILPGENLSEWPEIARALRNWPKYFKNHGAENPWKISRGLTTCLPIKHVFN